MYMLDTDICIYTIKRKPVSVLDRLETLASSELSMSAVTFAELMNGARKSQQVKANIERLEALAELVDVLPFDREAAVSYGMIRSELERRNEIIGGNDLLIAAHAFSRDCILVTNNEREFGRIGDLKIENWVNSSSFCR